MAVDYDLVVVGSSLAGIYAAKRAVQLQARVALITQSDSLFLPSDSLFNHNLATLAKSKNFLENNFIVSPEDVPSAFSLAAAEDWIEDTNVAVESINSLSNLAALGVDIIVGKGEFYRSPHLGIQIEQRRLKSRRFLLATGTNFAPNFSGSNHRVNYLTAEDLQNNQLANLPNNIIIIGSDPTALELAQILAIFDKKITLVVEKKSILPQEDQDISILVQAQLEAEGVKIVLNSVVSQIKTIDGKKWLQAGNLALSADEIIVADYRQANIAGLNLAGVGVKYDRQRVYVDRKLATTNPNIYACGNLIGGYSLPNIAQYEANIVLKNALFLPWYKTNYQALPWAILTHPSLARVGLNEKQARKKYEQVYVIRQYFSSVVQAKILDLNPGMCKLLVTQQGEIVGCSIFGDRATELITIPALMMQHKIKLDRNPMRGLTTMSIPNIYPSMADILEQAIDDFYQQKIEHNPKLLNRLKTWFSLRKN